MIWREVGCRLRDGGVVPLCDDVEPDQLMVSIERGGPGVGSMLPILSALLRESEEWTYGCDCRF